MEYEDILSLGFFGVSGSRVSRVEGEKIKLSEDEFTAFCVESVKRRRGEIEDNGLFIEVSADMEFCLQGGEKKSSGSVVRGEERDFVYNIYKYIDNINIQYYICGDKIRAFRFDWIGVEDFCFYTTALRHLIKREGGSLFPTFIPKPEIAETGAGLNIRFRLTGEMDKVKSFVAGLTIHAPECVVFTNSCVNSYSRLNSKECNHYVCVGEGEECLVRYTPSGSGCVCEMSFPDNSANVYLCILSLLVAGLKGVKNHTSIPDEVKELDPVTVKDLVRLPMTLEDGLSVAEGSGFLKEVLGERYGREYLIEKREESQSFTNRSTEGEYLEKYLPLL